MTANTHLPLLLVILLAATAVGQNQRETTVRADKKNIEADESWIYNELEFGRAQAKADDRPLLVLIRCLP